MTSFSRLSAFATVPVLLALMSAGQAFGAEAATETPEEITIIGGKRDVFKLEEQTFQAERLVYERFSALNEDQDYDIECHHEKATGSILTRTNCRPNYVDELLMTYGGGDREETVDTIPAAVIEGYAKKLQELMLKYMADDPALRAAVQEHSVLAKRLSESKKE
ncbi:MAG: hypothetical protein V4603_18175 [Pseudomonadota bacterium]